MKKYWPIKKINSQTNFYVDWKLCPITIFMLFLDLQSTIIYWIQNIGTTYHVYDPCGVLPASSQKHSSSWPWPWTWISSKLTGSSHPQNIYTPLMIHLEPFKEMILEKNSYTSANFCLIHLTNSVKSIFHSCYSFCYSDSDNMDHSYKLTEVPKVNLQSNFFQYVFNWCFCFIYPIKLLKAWLKNISDQTQSMSICSVVITMSLIHGLHEYLEMDINLLKKLSESRVEERHQCMTYLKLKTDMKSRLVS